jgi:hypothetical protein
MARCCLENLCVRAIFTSAVTIGFPGRCTDIQRKFISQKCEVLCDKQQFLRLLQSSRRVLAPYLLALICVLLFDGSGFASAHVTTGNSTAQQQIPQSDEAMTQRASPIILTLHYCGTGLVGPVCENPCTSICQGQAGDWQEFFLTWKNGPWAGLGFTFYWGDHEVSTYQCLLRCSTGYIIFDALYGMAGTYKAYVTASSTPYTNNTISMNIKGSDPSLQQCGAIQGSVCQHPCASICQGRIGQTQHFLLTWRHRGADRLRTFLVYWGGVLMGNSPPGNPDSTYGCYFNCSTYECYFNCSTGTTSFDQTYNEAGTFTITTAQSFSWENRDVKHYGDAMSMTIVDPNKK